MVSATLAIISLVGFLVLPLNFGIDMTGGVQIEYETHTSIDRSQLDTLATDIKTGFTYAEDQPINDIVVYPITGKNIVRVELGFSQTDGKESESIKELARDFVKLTLQELDADVAEIRYVNIGQSFGDYVKRTAYFTLILSMVLIAIYVAWAFRQASK